MSDHELFHEIVGEDNMRVRREIVALDLKMHIAFRNVHFETHRDRFAELGGSRTPALWDGTRLHEGREAVLRALRAMMPPR